MGYFYKPDTTSHWAFSFIFVTDVTCFQGFFHFSDMQAILEHFCVYHINAPGQDDGAVPLIQGWVCIVVESMQVMSTNIYWEGGINELGLFLGCMGLICSGHELGNPTKIVYLQALLTFLMCTLLNFRYF